MIRPSNRSVAAGVVGGLTNALAVGGLLTYYDYQILLSGGRITALVLAAFGLGFGAALLSAHTGFVAPGGGFLALLATVVIVELTSPAPQKVGELGGNNIVEGSFHAMHYAETWYLWLVLLGVAGVAEFAIRRGYGVRDESLRNIPELPLSRSGVVRSVAVCSGTVGAATMLVLVQGTLWDHVGGYAIGFVAAAIATAVPFAALLSRGVVVPVVLYGLVAATTFRTEVFGSPGSGLNIVFFGVSAVVLALVALLELFVRSRLGGWNGGRFVAAT